MCDSHQFKTEEEAEKTVVGNFKLLFGDYSILLPKSLIRASGGKGREAQGLPKPEYRQDAFILKAIVKNSGFGSKNLGIARLKSEILDAKLNASVRDKILQLVNEIQINQVFGAGDIVDILKCAPATATNLIKRMKTLNIVEPVVGAGKGKYVLRRVK
ncbi:hypothetical protein [Fibrobacter sp. UWB11]|uniref:hypothetical protein n=1 Tax=Fibrobacter sp. UWB11 TaxID=1896202 RepID=UPI00092904CC|nr:hypothetical protein [Fibrobacter sp. UWB11]SIO32171.1 hypothetical protein SAMN05720758_2266 [Fibrobacter sp. UWB11]